MNSFRARSSLYYAARIAVIYGIVAGLWVILSDRLVSAFVEDRHLSTLLHTAKGWLFVLITTVLLFLERTLSHQRLTQSELRVSNYFDYSMDGIILTDNKGRVTIWNPSMERIFAISPQRAEGRNIWEIAGLFGLKDMDGRSGEVLARRMLETGSPVVLKGSDDFLLADHTVIHVAQVIFTIPDSQGFVIGGFYRDETQSKKNERERESLLMMKDVLMKEIHHRVKNNLQMMASLLRLQESSVEDENVKRILFESRDRIRAMSMIHECLYQTGDYSFIHIGDYVQRLISGISGTYSRIDNKISFTTDIDDLLIKGSSAVPCALLLNELLTNVYKYAMSAEKTTEVFLSFKHIKDKGEMVFRDNGPGLPAGFDSSSVSSLGMSLITALSHQLGGEPSFRNDNGLVFEVSFPDNGIVSPSQQK